MQLHVFRQAAVLGFGLVGLLAGCSESHPADPRTDKPLVESWTVRSADTLDRSFTGTVEARVESDLAFRVNGKITQRLVDVGQHVRRGDPLMRLDPNDLSLDVTAQQGAVEAARARSVKADADLARLHGLVQQGAVSAQDYDLAVEAARSAKAQLDAAVARSDIARNADGYAVLRADMDGVIVSRAADAGQVVGAGQTVLVLAQDGPREALVTLPENVRPALGSAATAALYDSASSERSTASLRELSHSADPLTRTFAARYVLSGAASSAPLGSTVTIRLSEAQTAGGTTVPLGALYDRGHGPGVWVIGSDSTVTYRPVQVRANGAELATLSSGLNAGEKVVAVGAHQLSDHEQVRIATEQWSDGSPGTLAQGDSQ